MISFKSFSLVIRGELTKEAKLGEYLTHGAELAGLGVLAVPSYKKLRKIQSKETSPEERSDAKHELAGLGILAAPSALHLAHSAYKHLRR